MKGKIISLLKNRFPEHVSGEEISRLLGVSRTAVWKHIQRLKEEGYCIESQSKVGYRLLNAPDRLYEYELSGLVHTETIGSHIVYRETVESTNELAKELAGGGAPDGTVVVAEEQSGGKGRMGRSWHSPAGSGLWFSVILRPAISPAEASKITLVAAVAAAKTIREETGLQAGIKWPNDILLNSCKVAGILTEMNAETDRVNFIVVGIGINVNTVSGDLPPELAGIATSLREQKGAPVSRLGLLAALLNNLDNLYRECLSGNFRQILSMLKEMSVTLNRWVKITAISHTDEGIAFDIDDQGALLLMKKDGSMKRILSGDVSLR